MTSIHLKYVDRYQDRHGKQRHYFRRKGEPRTPLPGAPGSKSFMAAYAAALGGEATPHEIGSDRVQPQTIEALIVHYYGTTEYKQLKEVTKTSYRGVLERFRISHGQMPLRGLASRHVSGILDTLAGRPGAQQGLRRVLSILLRLATGLGWIGANPMLGIRRPRAASTGIRSWSEEDIEAFEARWSSGTKERLALALLLYTAQRRQDVILFGRQHIQGGRLVVRTSKSNEETVLEIPLHPALQHEIALVPKTQMTFIQSPSGKPYHPQTFSSWFDRAVTEAKIEGQATAHGLRKAALRRLAEAGCTANEIMAISGHKQLSEVTLYTKAADQKSLARAAFEKIASGTGSA